MTSRSFSPSPGSACCMAFFDAKMQLARVATGDGLAAARRAPGSRIRIDPVFSAYVFSAYNVPNDGVREPPGLRRARPSPAEAAELRRPSRRVRGGARRPGPDEDAER